MIFLSDKITVTVPVSRTAETGMYTYRIIRNENSETIFVGNFFYMHGSTSHTFNITDIVRSDVKPLTYNIFNEIFAKFNTHINSYHVEVDINGVTTLGQSGFVCKSYLYPNYNAITAPDMFFDTEEDSERIAILQQGHYKSGLADNFTDVLPIFPCFKNSDEWAYSEFPFWVYTECGIDVDEINVYGEILSEQGRQSILSEDVYSSGKINFNYSSRLKYVCNNIQTNTIKEFQMYISPTDFVGPDEGELFAVGYECLNKRYFLVWQDRLGSMMSKPFSEFVEYSESFNKQEVQDYDNERKLNTVQVNPKWKVSSGWIKETLYPLYESIYISPVLFLYDMKYNKCYNVMVKGDYTEKTYKNQKRLINITLELELANTQNIIY